MKLENQLVCQELSKKMRELGFEQESVYFWIKVDGRWLLYRGKGIGVEEEISAFSVAELGEKLKEAGPELTIKAYGDVFGFKGTGAIGSIGLINLLCEPDRLAKMLIYLRENKLI